MKADALRQAVARITASDSIIRDIFLQPMLPMPGIVPLWSPFCDRQIPVLRYDPAKAKDMLDQAGYRLDPKTKMRIDPNTGKPLRELKILTDTSATRSQIGKKLTDACRAIGLPAKYESDDWSAKQKRVSADDCDKFGQELDAVLEQLTNPADFAAARQSHRLVKNPDYWHPGPA
jgi:ABC-type transport system substrate-binding protein